MYLSKKALPSRYRTLGAIAGYRSSCVTRGTCGGAAKAAMDAIRVIGCPPINGQRRCPRPGDDDHADNEDVGTATKRDARDGGFIDMCSVTGATLNEERVHVVFINKWSATGT
jgi:hypothetical protein